MLTESDAYFMAQAMQLAKRGRYTTDPNPRVGCVLVKNGSIIGQGWHQRAGMPHAEIEALRDVDNARGATAYVSLEPCSHQGKTPPCCDALIEAGVGKVVAAVEDPNPLVAGRGLAKLRAAGIETDCGLMDSAAIELNRGFFHRMRTGKPFVVSKMAMSIDGRTAMASGESQWITSKQSRLDVHRLRASSSGIITSVDTLLADDCQLTARLEDVDVEQPVRVVLDASLRTPLSATMASLPGRSIILTIANDAVKIEALNQEGFEVLNIANDVSLQHVNLEAVLNFLGQEYINEVLIEAGSRLNGALLQADLINELVIYTAPLIIGDNGRGLFSIPEITQLSQAIKVKLKESRPVGPDLKLIFTVK